MEIKRDVTNMLGPLTEITREVEKDKYPFNDRFHDSTNPTNLFSYIPRRKKKRKKKKRLSLWRSWGRRGGMQQKIGRNI